MGSRRSLTLGLAGNVALLASRPFRTLALHLQHTPPPPMVLRSASGEEQKGGIGTYCWGTECVDMLSTPFPRCPLAVAAGEALTLDYAALGESRRLAYTIWRYPEKQAGMPSWDEMTPVRDGAIRNPKSPAAMPFDLPPGLYALEVFTRFRGGGDTQQGFTLHVLPAGAMATPEVTMATTPATGSECAEPGG